MGALKSLVLISLLTLVQMGFAEEEEIDYQNSWGSDGFNLESQDSNSVEIIFSIEKMWLGDLFDGTDTLTTVSISGIYLPNTAGAPNLPTRCCYIALPQGAAASVSILDSQTVVYGNLDIAPAPAIQIESDTVQAPEKDDDIYTTNAYYPEFPVQVSDTMKIRGVDVVKLGICPFQYNPATKDLIVYRDLQIQVNFNGGSGHFGADGLRSRHFEQILANNIINYTSLGTVDFDDRETDDELEGCDYYIFTRDNPSFITQANRIRDWRIKQGIETQVVLYDTLANGWFGSIYGLLQYYYWMAYLYPDQYEFPIAVLILGDAENSGAGGLGIPSWTYYYGPGNQYTCISDNYYADISEDNDGVPDLAIGRIFARDATELITMVDRMLDYEESPPTSLSFYDNPLLTGGFQADRWFMLCLETCRGFMVNELDKDPDHQYGFAQYWPYPFSLWCNNPYAGSSTNAVVEFFGPSGQGYVEADMTYFNYGGYAYGWIGAGNTSGIVNAIAAGAFAVLYRAHGSEEGWGSPAYHISDVANQTHPAHCYPFIFSITCLTGKFDYTGTNGCFAEYFTRMQPSVLETRGALGVNAASNVSFSYVNDVYTWGIWDHMWPEFDPTIQSTTPDGSTRLCPAFAMVNAKVYIHDKDWCDFMSQIPPDYYQYYKRDTNRLYHHFGDPFLTLYSEVPQNLQLILPAYIVPGANYITMSATTGSVIALTANGQIMGVATATGSSQNVPISYGVYCPTALTVTVTKPNYIRETHVVPYACPMPNIYGEVPVSQPNCINVVLKDYTTDGFLDLVAINLDSSGHTNIGKYSNQVVADSVADVFNFDTLLFSSSTLAARTATTCKARPSASLEDLVVGFEDRLGFFSLTSSTSNWITGLSNAANSISSGYIDGDDYQDLAVGLDATSVKYYLDNNGSDWLNSTVYNLNVGQTVKKVKLASMSDLWTQDQTQDLIVATGDSIKVYLNTGSGEYFNSSPSQTFAVGGTIADFEVVDLDNDRYSDLVVVCGSTLKCFKGNGSNAFTITPYYTCTSTTGNLLKVAVGEFNYDAYRDLAVLRPVDGKMEVAIFRNQKTSFMSDVWVGGTGLNTVNSLVFADIGSLGGSSLISCGVDSSSSPTGKFVVFKRIENPAPRTPAYFHAQANAQDHPVAYWAANPEADLDGYNVYRVAVTVGSGYQGQAFSLLATLNKTTTSYEDTTVVVHQQNPTNTFYYYVTAFDLADHESASTDTLSGDGCYVNSLGGQRVAQINLPTQFGVKAAPNPFNTQVDLKLTLPYACDVRMDLFDIAGRRVAEMYHHFTPAGTQQIRYDASQLASGIYFCRTVAGLDRTILRLVLIK